MKADDYREMSVDERLVKLEELQKQLFELKTQAVTEKLENTKAVASLKCDIARLKTVIRESELEINKK
ncbi:MAG TPA: 50S ribosomal protein L29 [Sedimentisphaerales bacterium]|nr:50S ribosomal protein L29 [Sedimentisphaerales bacterium]